MRTCFFLLLETETDRATEISILGMFSVSFSGSGSWFSTLLSFLSAFSLLLSSLGVDAGERMLLILSRVASSGERTGEDAVEGLWVLGDWGTTSVFIERGFCGFWSLSLSLFGKGSVPLPMLMETPCSGPLDAMLDEASEIRDLNDIGDGKGLWAFKRDSCSWPVGKVWLLASGLGPRGMFDVPRIFDALLTCVAGNREKLDVLDRVGDVARLGL